MSEARGFTEGTLSPPMPSRTSVDTSTYLQALQQARLRLSMRQRVGQTHADQLAQQKARLEGSLRAYTQAAWPLIEPYTPYVGGYHIDAITEHLEAVSRGQIKDLLINVPPRHSKSTIVCIMWMTWSWIAKPFLRWLFTSYAASLAWRDQARCGRLLRSRWYQLRWADTFRLLGSGGKLENDQSGYRLCMGVQGSVTGEGADIICLPGEEQVWTEAGMQPIGQIVAQQQRLRVWSYDTETGQTALQPIIGWVTNPGSPIVEVGLSDGARLHCTPDHQLWTCTRGWVRADALCAWDVLPGPPMSNVTDTLRGDVESSGQGTGTLVGVQDLAYLRRGQARQRMALTAWQVRDAGNFRGDISPVPLGPDIINRPTHDAICPRQDVSRLMTTGDLARLGHGQFGARSLFMYREGAVPLGVIEIHPTCAIGEVIQSWIQRIAIEMTPLVPIGTGADEGQQDQLMDGPVFRVALNTQADARIASIGRGFQPLARNGQWPIAPEHGSRATDDTPPIRDQIALTTGNRSPVFVRRHGFAPITYCLNVQDYHTFYAGSRAHEAIIVSNCVDDAHNVKEAHSITRREAVLTWWDQVMSTRRNHPATSARVIVGQRVHEGDLSGHVLRQGGYVHLCLPTEYEPRVQISSAGLPMPPPNPIGWVDPRTEPGQLLHPERFGPEQIPQIKLELGPFGWAGQHQQAPAPAEGGLVKLHWWQYWRPADRPDLRPLLIRRPGPGSHYEERHARVLPASFDEQLQSWDLRFTDLETSSYVAGGVWGKVRADRFLLDQVHAQWGIIATIEAMLALSATWPLTRRKLVENKANGPAVVQLLRRRLKGLTEVNPEGSKVSRLHACVPEIASGNVYLPHPDLYPWVQGFIDELALVPFSAYDDQCDQLTMALLWWDAHQGAGEAVSVGQSSYWNFGVTSRGEDEDGY